MIKTSKNANSLVVLLFLFLFLIEPNVFSQTDVAVGGIDKKWSCLKRKDLLRDKDGHPVWLTSEELMDRVLRRQPIERPGQLGRNNLRGIVRMRILIDNHGKVICAQAVAGHAMAIGPAIHSVRRWTFKVYTLNGEAKSVVGVLDVRYNFG